MARTEHSWRETCVVRPTVDPSCCTSGQRPARPPWRWPRKQACAVWSRSPYCTDRGSKNRSTMPSATWSCVLHSECAPGRICRQLVWPSASRRRAGRPVTPDMSGAQCRADGCPLCAAGFAQHVPPLVLADRKGIHGILTKGSRAFLRE